MTNGTWKSHSKRQFSICKVYICITQPTSMNFYQNLIGSRFGNGNIFDFPFTSNLWNNCSSHVMMPRNSELSFLLKLVLQKRYLYYTLCLLVIRHSIQNYIIQVSVFF